MKKNLAITLIMLICLCKALSLTINAESSAKTELNIEIKTVSHEENKAERSKLLSETSKQSENNSKKSKKFKTRKSRKVNRSLIESKQNSTATPALFINAAGQVVDQPMIVSTAPYVINRCDQIVAFKADLIPDLSDYTNRTSAYFTMTAYHLNVFDSNDSSTLKQSIILSFGKAAPTEPIGAQYCILNDGGDDKPLLFCASNQADSDSFKAALSTFSDCRAGKIIGGDSSSSSASTNSTAVATPSMSDLAKSCGFDGPMASPSTLLQQNTDNSAPDPSSEDFWLPGGQKVPGAPAVDPDAPAADDDSQ